jgi:serine/threonine protein kinase
VILEGSGLIKGQIVGSKYRLVSPIGQGAMGSVWHAERVDWDAPVALKLLAPELSQSQEFLLRFEREVRLAAALRSPHVVQVLDHGFDTTVQCAFIAMELLEGESLSGRLSRLPRLTPAETVQIVAQIVKALSRAHAAGIIHRDLKPENLFLVYDDGDVLVKVLDFGIAKWTSASLRDALTRPGTALGTPLYMSPEQIRGLPNVDHRADLWSVGVITCECLTGRRPFVGSDIGELAALLLNPARHPKPSSLGPAPPKFDEWFARATHRDISCRFQTARELVEALAPICGATPESVPAGSRSAPPLDDSATVESRNGSWLTQVTAAKSALPSRWLGISLLIASVLAVAGALTERHGQRGADFGLREESRTFLEPQASVGAAPLVPAGTGTSESAPAVPPSLPVLVPATAGSGAVPSHLDKPVEPAVTPNERVGHRRKERATARDRREKKASPITTESSSSPDTERIEINGRPIRTVLE